MKFISYLPQEAVNVRYNILAPAGGLEREISQLIEAVRLGQSARIDLDVFLNDYTSRIRVTPDFQWVTVDTVRPSVYHIEKAYGVFLDAAGIETDNLVEVYADISTNEIAEGMPTGILIMWNLPDVSEEFQQTKG